MYVRTGQVPGSKEFTGCTPCWERAHLSRFDHSREECPRYWDAIVTGLPWKDGELWEGGRFFCEGCTEPTPEEVAKAKAAGLAPHQPGNMTTQQARGDAGQEPVYLVEDSAFEVYYADVELPAGGFQNQPFYKGSEGKGKGGGRSLRMKLKGRMQGQELELTWHATDEGGRATTWAEVTYEGGVKERVEKFRGWGVGAGVESGGPVTWEWCVQDGTRALGLGTKPKDASQDGASKTSINQEEAGLRGHGGGSCTSHSSRGC